MCDSTFVFISQQQSFRSHSLAGYGGDRGSSCCGDGQTDRRTDRERNKMGRRGESKKLTGTIAFFLPLYLWFRIYLCLSLSPSSSSLSLSLLKIGKESFPATRFLSPTPSVRPQAERFSRRPSLLHPFLLSFLRGLSSLPDFCPRFDIPDDLTNRSGRENQMDCPGITKAGARFYQVHGG